MVPPLAGFICELTPLFRIPSVRSAFGFHLHKCQAHFAFKNNAAGGFACPM